MSDNPTGDEREALARIIDPAIYPDINRLTGDGWAASLRAADAILARFRLVPRGEAESDDREVDIDPATGDFDPNMAVMLSQSVPDEPVWSCVVIARKFHAAGFRRGAPAGPVTEVTDEMVGRAVAAWYGFPHARGVGNLQNAMRAALVAALEERGKP